ncbi:MAG: hypothetical protein IPK93_01220 [Solirubrobacterales bacterium]|nr:hypothetical protein [Solirubrobacterales bacterium]
MKTTLGVVAATVLILVAGCGGGSSESDQDQVNELNAAYATALKDKEFGNACKLFSSEAIDSMKEKDVGCEGAMAKIGAFISDEDLEDLGDVQDLEVDGDEATGTVGDAGEAFYVRENGEWKFGPPVGGEAGD